MDSIVDLVVRLCIYLVFRLYVDSIVYRLSVDSIVDLVASLQTARTVGILKYVCHSEALLSLYSCK